MGYVETHERGSLHARAHTPDQIIEDLQAQVESAIAAAEEIEARWEQPSIENHRVSVVNRFETVAEGAATTCRTPTRSFSSMRRANSSSISPTTSPTLSTVASS